MGTSTAKPFGQSFFESPWPWLAYLPFYAIPWLWLPPTRAQLGWAVAGIALFLILYWVATRCNGWRLLAATTAILLLSFALAPTGGNWTVIAIYAVASVAEHRPQRVAVRALALYALSVILFALVIGALLPWGLLGALMMVMVGYGALSQAALRDKTLALANAQDELRRLAATAERERIGRDLHDLLGRTLTLAAIKAELAAKLSPFDPARAEAEMRAVADASRAALAEVRAAVAGMTGASLMREIQASRTALEAAGIAPSIVADPAAVADQSAAVLAMTLREAVTNVIRHSGAGTCRIMLSISGTGCKLTVSDDGNGLPLREGGGLQGLRARLAAAGGSLALTASAEGTWLVATVPKAGVHPTLSAEQAA
jgi:two-component system sensor histidine kinase DesK